MKPLQCTESEETVCESGGRGCHPPGSSPGRRRWVRGRSGREDEGWGWGWGESVRGRRDTGGRGVIRKEVAFWFSKWVSWPLGLLNLGLGWPRNARFTRQRTSRGTTRLIRAPAREGTELPCHLPVGSIRRALVSSTQFGECAGRTSSGSPGPEV